MEMTYCRRWISEIKDIAKGTIQNETGEKNTKEEKKRQLSVRLYRIYLVSSKTNLRKFSTHWF